MKILLVAGLISLAAPVLIAAEASKAVPILDGKTFQGWEGDTNNTWRIAGGAFVGGSLTTTVPRNEFLATTRSFTNFVLLLPGLRRQPTVRGAGSGRLKWPAARTFTRS